MVVEDYEPFRRFVCAALRRVWELKIIEASDGLDAVQKSKELQPDLILLDVGLPKLHGIEVARRILELRPKSKILFLSENRSSDIVEEALRSGAMGYVVKCDAGRELLPAVEAVLEDRRFLSASLAGQNFTSVADEPSAAMQQFRTAESARRHEVGFYADDGDLLDDIVQFIGPALKNGNAAIVIATAFHRDGVLAKLQLDDLNIAAAIEQGRFVVLDAADTLAAVMKNGMLDPARFLRLMGSLILTTAKAAQTNTGEQGRVAIFGECVNLLWTQGNEDVAIEFEKLGNELLNTYDIEILCGYSHETVQRGMQSPMFQRVCAEHSAVHHRS
jgi:DNA-binding NarL/FixJ family response regulator